MNIKFGVNEVKDNKKKSFYTREILQKLPEWFGNKEALDEYVKEVQQYPYWAAFDVEEKCIGFSQLKYIIHILGTYLCVVSSQSITITV